MERLGDVARRTLAAAGPAAGGDLLAIAQAWPAVVGPAVAAAAWPHRIARDGTLHVATSSSVWAFELGRMQGEILDRLRAQVPGATPTSLRFAVGPVPAADAVPLPDGDPLPAPTESERVQASAMAATIDDADLRESVARAAAASLARARSDRRFW